MSASLQTLECLLTAANSGMWELKTLKDTVEELEVRKTYTPDFRDLSLGKEHLVLLYNNMKVGFKRNYVVGGTKFLGRGVTLTKNYFARKCPDDCYAWIMDIKDAHMQGMVSSLGGHIFAMSPQELVHLDAHMQNNVDFVRKKVYVEMLDQFSPHRSGAPVIVDAWVYTIRPEARSRMIIRSVNCPKTYITDRGLDRIVYDYMFPEYN